MPASVRVRAAQPDDVQLIFGLVCQLAEYEHSANRVVGNPELLAQALFGADPVAEALIGEVDSEPAGFALFYRTFSTWECRPGIWLEDLYVEDRWRRAGVGTRLLDAVVDLARRRGYTRVEWSALDWNTPALDFYARQGAQRLDEWVLHRLEVAGLRGLTASGQPSAGAPPTPPPRG